MEQISKELEKISTKVIEEENRVELEIKYLPKGRLCCEKQEGWLRFVKETYEDGKRKRRNLAVDDPELPGLLKRRILEAELLQLRVNSMLLKAASEGVKDFDITNEMYRIKFSFLQHKQKAAAGGAGQTAAAKGAGQKAAARGAKLGKAGNEKEFAMLLDELFSKALADDYVDDWAARSYEKLQYQNDFTKWQMTSFGLRVRSKSELIIAEMLHKYKIPFRYEQLLHFDTGTLAPDFTIKRSDGKIFYWEHEGLTNSNDYLNKQLKKSQIYAMNRIVPWDNLIVTYDNSAGQLDSRIVESEIQNKLIV